MFVSDKWIDYELLEVADGEKLERWGKYTLIRPDPQVIWKDVKTSNLWKLPVGKSGNLMEEKKYLKWYKIGFVYSVFYNGLYMIPEIVITALVAVPVSKISNINKDDRTKWCCKSGYIWN